SSYSIWGSGPLRAAQVGRHGRARCSVSGQSAPVKAWRMRMPIEVGIWRLGAKLEPVGYSRMDSENRLETVLADDVAVVDPDLLLIGRQVPTAFGKFIDLLALDSEGRVVVL